jgi:hypothetical protein
VRRIVHGVHKHAPGLGRRGHLSIHVAGGRRHDEPYIVEIGGSESAPLDRYTRLFNLVAHLGRDDADMGADSEQLTELGRRDRSAADEQDAASRKVEKEWKEPAVSSCGRHK